MSSLGHWLERSRQSAARALQLDTDNKRALTVMAKLAVNDNLWFEAGGLYRRALDKHPGDAEVLAAYAQFLYKVGYATQALEVAERVFRLDPFSPVSSRLVAIGLLARGDLGPAMEHIRLSGQLRGSRDTVMVALVLDAQGQHRQAGQVLEEDGWATLGWRKRWLPHLVNALEGNESNEIVLQLMGEADQHGMLEPVTAIIIYSALGEIDEALAALNEYGSIGPFVSLWLPIYDELRKDPRFIDTMTSFGVADFWQQRGPPDGCENLGDSFLCD